MPEQQNIEYKQNWHDDYLKWVCGFANAQGGRIYIGKDDAGKTVGVENHKPLMDEIPNKIKNCLGITAEVNLLQEDGKHLIEIGVLPYSVPISLRGRYYYRSGSVKQELAGAALNEFLLKRSGRTWDDVIEPRAGFADIDETVFYSYMKTSQEKGRMPDIEGLTTEEILDKLRLTENGQLKRAAVILFGKDPGRFYPNTFVKIGRFVKDDADLRFHEVEDGNLIVLVKNVLTQLNRHFLVRPITFEGMYRVENDEYPVPAIREMLLNALIHRNYMGAPTLIKVYDDKINIWNEGTLPEGLTPEMLRRPHPSKPRNPLIANVCFKGGMIDAWGSGTVRIINACKQAGLSEPEMIEDGGGFLVTIFKNEAAETEEQPAKLEPNSLLRLGLNPRQVKAVQYVLERGRITNKEYQEINSVARHTATRELAELTESYRVLANMGKGAGSYFEIIAT